MKNGKTKYRILQVTDLKNGFGLVEVLVAMVLLGIIAVGFSSLLTGAMKSQKGIQAKDQQREITAEIRSLLSNQRACLNSFFGRNPQTGFTVMTIFDGATPGNAKYKADTPDKTGLLEFKGFEVSNYVPDAVVLNQGNADLKVKLARVGDTGSTKNLFPGAITLKVKVMAGNITECYSIGSNSDSYWQMSATVPNAIYYAGGNVGIGVPAPTVSLDVLGSVRSERGHFITKNPNGAVVINAGPLGLPQAGIWFRSANVLGDDGAYRDLMYIDANGNVGINTTAPVAKLDVAGPVRGSTFTGASFTGGTFTGTSFAGGTFTGASFLYTSDSRLKKNIFKLTEGLDLVFKMKPVRYQWKATSKGDIGFIAQDIEKILPELTATDDDGIKRIDYAKIVPILVRAIQEQQIQIGELQKKLNTER